MKVIGYLAYHKETELFFVGWDDAGVNPTGLPYLSCTSESWSEEDEAKIRKLGFLGSKNGPKIFPQAKDCWFGCSSSVWEMKPVYIE